MQVCLNGHYITDCYHTEPKFRQQYCTTCGAATTIHCPNCNAEIKGDYLTSDVFVFGYQTPVPDICEYCGKDFPWKSRKEVAKKKEQSATKEGGAPSMRPTSEKKEKWIKAIAVAQTKMVLEELLQEPFVQSDEKTQTSVVNLSSRWHMIEEQRHRDTVDFEKLFIQTNKIHEGLIALIRKL